MIQMFYELDQQYLAPFTVALQLSQQQQTKECTLHITKILPQRHLTGNQATEKYYNVLITVANIFKQTNKQTRTHITGS
jgi:hypothetical protein